MSEQQTQRASSFQLFSLGIVVEDKERNSDTIKVYPVEHLPMLDGKLSDYKPEYKASVPDSKGTLRNSKTEGKAIIEAKWLPFGHSNRLTSPDVIKNETVIIFRYADTEEYHWTTIFREPGIRRKETVVYAYGNKETPLEKWDKNSSYWFAVSTHDKYIHLHTSRSDGEFVEFDIHIDTKYGSITMSDGLGNYSKFDSKTGEMTMNMSHAVTINTPKFTVNSKEITQNSDKHVNNAKNGITNNTPNVSNTGNVSTSGSQNIGGSSYANPHYNSVH